MRDVLQVTGTYDPNGDVDLTGFAGSMTTYAASVAALLLLGRTTGYELPEKYSFRDLAVGGIATHKLSRLVARASVTSPIRAPFTKFKAPAGAGEHEESARGDHGVKHTIGELLTCPFCLAVWVGTAYVAGLATAPRLTRAVAAVMTVVATSDALQHGYQRLRGD
jgi:hypothetical protein